MFIPRNAIKKQPKTNKFTHSLIQVPQFPNYLMREQISHDIHGAINPSIHGNNGHLTFNVNDRTGQHFMTDLYLHTNVMSRCS